MKNSCDRVIKQKYFSISFSWGLKTISATLQTELWDLHEGFPRGIMESNFENLNRLSYFASMKVIKSRDKMGVFGKGYAVNLNSTSLWEVFGSVGVWPLFQALRKNIQLSHLESEMCNLHLRDIIDCQLGMPNHQKKSRTWWRCINWVTCMSQEEMNWKLSHEPGTGYVRLSAQMWQTANIGSS